jgi:hypothetical protein
MITISPIPDQPNKRLFEAKIIRKYNIILIPELCFSQLSGLAIDSFQRKDVLDSLDPFDITYPDENSVLLALPVIN